MDEKASLSVVREEYVLRKWSGEKVGEPDEEILLVYENDTLVSRQDLKKKKETINATN